VNVVSDPIVAVDTSTIREGKLEEVKAAVDELVAFVEENEADVISYQVYVDGDEGQMTVLQIHPSSHSMELHMEMASPVFRRFRGLLELTRVDFYGRPSDGLLKQMREKATLLGDAPVVVNNLHAGFSRLAANRFPETTPP
jgi:quinol monooxygenase YgiN